MNVLVITLVLAAGILHSDAIVCRGKTKKGILNHNHRASIKLQSSGVENIEDMLKGSRKTLVKRGSLSFSLEANGMRSTPNGPVQKGFSSEKLCFISQCVNEVTGSFIGRTPDAKSSLDDQGNVRWMGTGGGTGGLQTVRFPNPEILEEHCLDAPSPVGSLSYTFSQKAILGNICTSGNMGMKIKGFYMRACVDK